MVVEEESTEGADQTLEVTVLARSTQAMPMDSALRRTLREIRQIAAERRELEALRQRGSLGALGIDLLSLGQVRTLTLTLTLTPTLTPTLALAPTLTLTLTSARRRGV